MRRQKSCSKRTEWVGDYRFQDDDELMISEDFTDVDERSCSRLLFGGMKYGQDIAYAR